MKNKITDKLNIGTFFCFIILLVCVFLLAENFPLCRSIVEKATVLSAKTVLVGAKAKKTQEPFQASEEESDTSDDESEKEQNEDESEKTDADSIKQTESVSALVDESFTKDPEDIQRLIEEYSKNADKDKKDGSITELTYKTSGVTDSYKNVRVKNVNDTEIKIKELLKSSPDIKITDKSQPTVLIYHTHTTEAYQILDRSFYAQEYTSRSKDNKKNMVRVGDEICKQLESAGFTVIHDTTIYDEQYNGAYKRSRAAVEEYLATYPSIQVTLDIHRDAIQYNDGTKVKPVAEIMGKKCAQMMIITGCQESGNGISGFDDWEYNLIFALHLQKQLEDMFSGIMRPLYFCPRKYNMDVNHCSLLVEMGSDANTLGEGVYAGKCLGTALAAMLENYCTEHT